MTPQCNRNGRWSLARRALILIGIGAACLPAVPGAEAQSVPTDSTVFADAATERLVRAAAARHYDRSTQLAGYKARVYSRVEGHVGASRWGRGVPVFQYETVAQMHWAQPGDLQVDILGAQAGGPRLPGLNRDMLSGFWTDLFSDEVWFVPSAIGDEIQIMGLPDEEAIHPLAGEADEYYRYAIRDSVRLGLPGRVVRAVSIRVEPRVTFDRGPAPRDPRERRRWRRRWEDDPTLVSGEMWLDADSLDVVRLSVAFVGPNVWDEDEDSPDLINLEADLEYALLEDRFWLPHRQVLSANFRYKYLPGANMPALAVTTFSDHELDVLQTPIVASEGNDLDADFDRRFRRRDRGGWNCPDPWDFDDRGDFEECGARGFTKVDVQDDGTTWTVSVPNRDSLERYDFDYAFDLTQELAGNEFLEERIAGLADISARLPPEQQLVTQRVMAVDWRRVFGTFGFNRVQGPSLAGATVLRTPWKFTTLNAGLRFGFGDLRPMPELEVRRDGPSGLFRLHAARSIRDVEPWTRGTGIGNTYKALLAGHDDADYYYFWGGGFAYQGYAGALRDVTFSLQFERQRSAPGVRGSVLSDIFFGDGDFPENPSITPGDYVRGGVTRSLTSGATRLDVGVEALVSRAAGAGRGWVAAFVPATFENTLATVRLRGGAQVGDPLPQMQYRVGGPSTVRGYDYGHRRGDAFWAAQFDLEWTNVSQWWGPIVFADVGDVNGSSSPLVSLGTGVSALSGWMRLELAKGVNPSRPVRFDILFQMPLH